MKYSTSNDIDSIRSTIEELKPVYKTRDGRLHKEFFMSCFAGAISYKRSAGFFSSSVLKIWAGILPRLVKDGVTIKLLISPELSALDRAALQRAQNEKERSTFVDGISHALIESATKLQSNPGDEAVRTDLLIGLIVSGQLEIKFAVPRHIDDAGMFHEKSGVFEFPWGEKIGFEGSANETESGLIRNYEKIHVFKSWEGGEIKRIDSIEEDFDYMWSGMDDCLIVRPLSKESLELVRTRDRERRAPQKPVEDRKWRHQREAIEEFLKSKAGILEMATGTGKSKTALRIAEHLIEDGSISSIILATDGNDLLNQWAAHFLEWPLRREKRFRLLQQYETYKQAESFKARPNEAILVVSRDQLDVALRNLPVEIAKKTLIIHDEIHGMGSGGRRERLQGLHAGIIYKLGLSATPTREYDDEGTNFIFDEIGPVIFQFGLREAIERGILVEFDYVALPYMLTDGDRERLRAVYSRQAARKREGRPMTREEVWTELSKVYKKAEEKPEVFREFIHENQQLLKDCIIFVEDKEFGMRVMSILHEYTNSYRTYYSEDDISNLRWFSEGKIDCLITCHKISQGIDIQRLRHVILFSSARARLETTQRIGRCLRYDPQNPDKKAVVVDFVREQEKDSDLESADDMRFEWLTELAKTRRSKDAN